ncbi:hypothetical protein QC763_0047270 [Podospora pseudopauciseta]|uniref:Uncharacterized protein n=2 Tax=Podospora TaxID=5144 RepID=A0ABR0HF26_9PEZI|nr:hypothetical protein QC763_0047270 [Podospora pseudopauciseta]KAK4677635.1 hypothetical protein QC764_0046870 [Podospora pseudoanserina]
MPLGPALRSSRMFLRLRSTSLAPDALIRVGLDLCQSRNALEAPRFLPSELRPLSSFAPSCQIPIRPIPNRSGT